MADRSIVYMALSELRPHPRNPKAHDLDTLRASVGRFGYTQPIVYDERTGLILAGHGRWMLLSDDRLAGRPVPDGVEAAGDEWLVPVVRGYASADDDEALAYLVADNEQARRGSWNDERLAAILAPLAEAGRLSGTGFMETDVLAALGRPKRPPAATGKEPSYEERQTGYRHSQVRSIVFDFPLPEYEAVSGAADRCRARAGVATNAELFLVLLRSAAAVHGIAVPE